MCISENIAEQFLGHMENFKTLNIPHFGLVLPHGIMELGETITKFKFKCLYCLLYI